MTRMNTNPNTKRILCYGDSYTWGYKPATDHKRFPAHIRWTGILQDNLGDTYEVIEEGLNSRTLTSDDERPGKEGRNGSTYLIPCLDTHDPIDLVILMLGTNELKDAFDTSAQKIGHIIEDHYVKIITQRVSQFRKTTPKLLLISPPMLDLTKEYAQKRYAKSAQKNDKLANIYQSIAKKHSAYFLDAGSIVTVGADGVHFDAENHRKFGMAVYEMVVKII